MPQLLGMLRCSLQPSLNAERFTILHQSQLCHLMCQIVDIFSFGLYAPLFCDTDQFIRIFYFVSAVRISCVESMADLTSVIRVSSCTTCSEFQVVTSYDTMSIASADSSRSLRGNTARSHCTDTAADTLLTKFTMRSLILYTNLPCISTDFRAGLEQPVGSCFHFFDCG